MAGSPLREHVAKEALQKEPIQETEQVELAICGSHVFTLKRAREELFSFQKSFQSTFTI